MKRSDFIMGMPVRIEVVDAEVSDRDFEKVFDYLRGVDMQFSTYKKESEVMKINRGEISEGRFSSEMREIIKLCMQTKKQTNGYFDAYHDGFFDPSGLVKGYAIKKAAELLIRCGMKNFYVEIAGDVQVSGLNQDGEAWRVGIRNPFRPGEVVKIVGLTNSGIATSGDYNRGEHIYNPKGKPTEGITSMTVIGPDVYEADRFATAAYAMGSAGIEFIQKQEGLDGYMIGKNGKAVFTSGFENYVLKNY